MTRNLINRKLNDIISTGYSEKNSSFHVYSPMMWWLYLKIEDKYILLVSDSGSIVMKEVDKIECNFDIDDDDLFTISSVYKNDFGIIDMIDLFYDNHSNLIGLGMNIKYSDKYVFIDSLNYNGFNIDILNNRNYVIENFVFYKLENTH